MAERLTVSDATPWVTLPRFHFRSFKSPTPDGFLFLVTGACDRSTIRAGEVASPGLTQHLPALRKYYSRADAVPVSDFGGGML